MIDWVFALNDKPMSALVNGLVSFPAFSGLNKNVNRRTAVCLANEGPLPFGVYYIIDRQSGGRLGALYDYFNGHPDWFALYADDGKIDDETFCNNVKRGNFMLHPKGSLGISKGCITIDSKTDFIRLQTLLKSTSKATIPGTSIQYYGKVTVK